jgi:hypothetical protein
VAAADRHTAAGKPLSTFPRIASDHRLEQLELQAATLEADLAGLRKLHGDEAPEIQQARARHVATRAANHLVEWNGAKVQYDVMQLFLERRCRHT